MNGILAVNHFLKGEKYDTLHKHLAASAKKCGINLNIKTNLELATQKAQADFVLFWDKDINLARRIEKSGVPVFNSAESIEKCVRRVHGERILCYFISFCASGPSQSSPQPPRAHRR